MLNKHITLNFILYSIKTHNLNKTYNCFTFIYSSTIEIVFLVVINHVVAMWFRTIIQLVSTLLILYDNPW